MARYGNKTNLGGGQLPQQTTQAAQPPSPPVFTTLPTINPASAVVNSIFTATDGQASNATSYTRRWLYQGTSIGVGGTISPPSAGMLQLEVTAFGPGGSTIAPLVSATISAAAPAPTPTPTPTLTLSPTSATVAANASPGQQLFALGNVPTGVVPTVTPNDGRFVIAGVDGARTLVVGMSALSAGLVNVTIAAAGATSVSSVVTITTPTSESTDFTIQTRPAIAGTSGVGNSFTRTAGTYVGATVTGFAFRRNGVKLTGLGTASPYVSVGADAGTFLDVVDILSVNSGGTAEVASTAIGIVPGLTLDGIYDGKNNSNATIGTTAPGATFPDEFDLTLAYPDLQYSGAFNVKQIFGGALNFFNTTQGRIVYKTASALNLTHESDLVGNVNGVMAMVWNYSDPNNYCYMQNYFAGVTSSPLRKIIAGIDQDYGGGAIVNWGRALVATDKITYARVGNQEQFLLNGEVKYTGTAQAPTGTNTPNVGFRCNNSNPQIDNWITRSSSQALSVTSTTINSSGELTVAGIYTGTAPTAISVQVLDRFGIQQQALTVYPGTIGDGTFSVQGGDLRSLGGTTARVMVSNGLGATVPLILTVQGFVPAVPARIGMNVPTIISYSTETYFSNTSKFCLSFQNLNDADNEAAMLPFLDAAGNLTGIPSNGVRFRSGAGEASGSYQLTYRLAGGSPSISGSGLNNMGVSSVSAPVAVAGQPGYFRITYTQTFDRSTSFGPHVAWILTGGWIDNIDNREVGRDMAEVIRPEAIARYAVYSVIRPMDVMQGNAAGFYEGDWSGRTLPTDAGMRSSTGVAIEHLIQHHNGVNAIRASQGKDKAAFWPTPPLYASADYWFKFCRALFYGEYTTNGIGLVDGTPVIFALNGNEQWNIVAGSSGKASLAIALRDGRATAGEVSPGNGQGQIAVVRREYAFCINKNGPRVAAAVPDKMSQIFREVNLQLDNGLFEAQQIVGGGADLSNFEMFTGAPYPGDYINNSDGTRDLTVLFDRLDDSIDNFDAKIGSLKTYCNTVGKRLAFYEGNKSLLHSNLTLAEQQAFDGDPRMKTAMRRIIDSMTVRGDYCALFLNTGAQQAAPNASFGWARYQGDNNWPPQQALIEAIAALPANQR